MKKFLNKKVKIFEKEFSVFLIALVAMIGVASAALVPYLSNVVSGDFQTSSPLLVEISSDAEGWYSAAVDMALPLNDIYGGEITTFYVRVTNQADVEVPSDLAVEISSDYGEGDEATCEDFTNVVITSTRTVDGSTDAPVVLYDGDLDGVGCDDSTGALTFLLDSYYLVDESEEYQVDLTSDLAIAPSVYTVVAREMDKTGAL